MLQISQLGVTLLRAKQHSKQSISALKRKKKTTLQLKRRPSWPKLQALQDLEDGEIVSDDGTHAVAEAETKKRKGNRRRMGGRADAEGITADRGWCAFCCCVLPSSGHKSPRVSWFCADSEMLAATKSRCCKYHSPYRHRVVYLLLLCATLLRTQESVSVSWFYASSEMLAATRSRCCKYHSS